MGWTDDRVKILKKMWAEGHSASVIAKELGDVTRNAVIGKVHRLGLSNRGGQKGTAKVADKKKTDTAPSREKSTQPAAKKPAVQEEASQSLTVSPIRKIIPAGQRLPPQPSNNEISPEALEKVSRVEKKAKKISLLELTERTCKWPIGDPSKDNFWFCGLPAETGKPYCEAHVGVAFQQLNNRRDRRK